VEYPLASLTDYELRHLTEHLADAQSLRPAVVCGHVCADAAGLCVSDRDHSLAQSLCRGPGCKFTHDGIRATLHPRYRTNSSKMPVVLKFSVVSTPLKFLRLVVYWTAR
jgi:hypothetical protein